MTSCERVMAYTSLPAEIDLRVDGKTIAKEKPVPDTDLPGRPGSVPSTWPDRGGIQIHHLGLRYPGRSYPILDDICAHVQPGEKVAIVGRTGAGKSSLLASFLRLTGPDPTGCIVIDGVDIGAMDLGTLRQRISVIPQDPATFSGSIRFNLDPYLQYDDQQLWHALSLVSLSVRVSGIPDKLDGDLKSGTSTFSVGERQLLCLARAILRNTRVIFMDEATANIDLDTSARIQGLVRTAFRDATVFTIAHRLQTVIDYDRVMVLEGGKLVELDTPWQLLQNEKGLFSSMVREMGQGAEREMKFRAYRVHHLAAAQAPSQ